jgi:hypothetical protein
MAQLESITRDGFRIRKTAFATPSNVSSLDTVTKRKMTICNLFANHLLSIPEIVRILDETSTHVITTLIDQGLIHERRKNPRENVPVERRRFPYRKN